MIVYLVMHGMPYDAYPAERVFKSRESAEQYIANYEATNPHADYSQIVIATLES